jgi:hypothetical protein
VAAMAMGGFNYEIIRLYTGAPFAFNGSDRVKKAEQSSPSSAKGAALG